jgi:hypothetical protein
VACPHYKKSHRYPTNLCHLAIVHFSVFSIKFSEQKKKKKKKKRQTWSLLKYLLNIHRSLLDLPSNYWIRPPSEYSLKRQRYTYTVKNQHF